MYEISVRKSSEFMILNRYSHRVVKSKGLASVEIITFLSCFHSSAVICHESTLNEQSPYDYVESSYRGILKAWQHIALILTEQHAPPSIKLSLINPNV